MQLWKEIRRRNKPPLKVRLQEHQKAVTRAKLKNQE